MNFVVTKMTFVRQKWKSTTKINFVYQKSMRDLLIKTWKKKRQNWFLVHKIHFVLTKLIFVVDFCLTKVILSRQNLIHFVTTKVTFVGQKWIKLWHCRNKMTFVSQNWLVLPKLNIDKSDWKIILYNKFIFVICSYCGIVFVKQNSHFCSQNYKCPMWCPVIIGDINIKKSVKQNVYGIKRNIGKCW